MRTPPPTTARTALRKDSTGTNPLIRDAKGQSIDLKAMLKKKDPWDRQIEFQREALRKVYLQILFQPTLSPSTAEAIQPTPSSSNSHTSRLLSVLNLLWLETSHSFIHHYRTALTTLDATLANAPRPRRGEGGPGPTARRKLIHAFRTFLAGEEDFWRILLGRLGKTLDKRERDRLRALGVSFEDDDEPAPAEGDEEPVPTEQELAKSRERAVPLVHKALIFFGDIARYRELYNEPGGGTPGGSRDRKGRGGGAQGRTHGGQERKVKNWSKAADCYQQARLLIPDNGNPSNQLAVLSQYSSDFISSTYHYHRALAVRQPFPTARTNLEIAYLKFFTRYFDEQPAEETAGDEGAQFKIAFVVLHGLYFTKSRLDEIAALETKVQDLFNTSVEQRLLLSDVIVKTVVTALCSLWDARMFRSGGKKTSSQETASQDATSFTPPEPAVPNLEPHILTHVLSIFRVLLTIGATETTELHAANSPDPTIPLPDLALNISAVLRRLLPALRILSKWLMGQLDYISRVVHRASDPLATSNLKAALKAFWVSYAQCASALALAFPEERLPNAIEGEVWLEEDVDLLGFVPLRRGMKEGVAGADGKPKLELGRVGKELHPNEEQLMRIGEVLRDARLVAESNSSGIEIVGGDFVVRSMRHRQPVSDPHQQDLTYSVDDLVIEEEDGSDEGYAGTEDDPVDLAMRIGAADRMEMDDDEDEDDEEDIVYAGLSHSQLLAGPSSHPPFGQTSAPGPPVVTNPRPANDLLHQMLSNSPSRSIWGAPESNNALPPPTSSSSSLLRGSFESMPNTTHRGSFEALPNTTTSRSSAMSFSRNNSFSSPPGGGLPHPSSMYPLPPPQPIAAANSPLPSSSININLISRSPSVFGSASAGGGGAGFSSFLASPSRALPPAFSSSPKNSDLSPHANQWSPSKMSAPAPP